MSLKSAVAGEMSLESVVTGEMSLGSAVARLSASFQEERNGRKRIVVYDCRREHREASEMLETNGLDFNAFLQRVSKEFAIHSKETFVLTTTDRTVLDFDGFEELQDGNTLHLWQREDQVLPGATEEHIVFLPHYDTLVRSGMYEYYASSDGQKSLPYALAELIDNALSATARNKGVRAIEIRLLFDETLGKPAVIVLDNGCGMTSKQLNNWAVYRLSKFTRESNTFASNQKSYVRPDHVPRSLNSDISYFGVGGKQAGFYIGESTRMITKPMGFPDVHELIISKEEFERKEKNKEDIYRGVIRNRKPGDHSHVKQEDEGVLHDLIAEECGKESFTAVVITGIQPEHITFLKQDFPLWTRELAHLYHYYIHGFNGNDMRPCSQNTDRLHNIDIQIYLREKPPRCPRVLNLREIDNDMQTLYINSSTDTFEFKASTEDHGTVEGVLRYHPFLYDKETYPQEADAELAPIEDDDDNDSGVVHQARGKRPIFECFWNGRLIPYTTISEFEWCARPKKAGAVPAECYSRVSGVLFTDDRFQVSTNKLTFMDLELQLKNKDTIFTRIVKGQEQRVNIQREFTQWLKKCHESWDKQVKFLGFKGTITRTDAVPKKMQHPWATFSSIALDGKRYKTGQYVKSQKTQPIFFGSVVQFLLYGDHDGDVYATGGQVQIALEPKALYNEFKTIPICKIDRTTTVAAIKKSIDNELDKLPHKLNVEWPEGNAWSENAVHPAGTPLGPLQVTILNKKGETLSRMPSVSQGTVKKLLMELKVVWHGPFGDQETNSHIAQHSKWAFWFKPMENLTKLGKYTLYLNTMLNESNDSSFGGTQLPSYKLQFTITEGSAHTFVVGAVSSPLHVGVPFNIPLELLDVYGHPTQPPTDLKPVLECSGLDLSYEGLDTNGTTFTIRNVKARGKIQNYHSKTYDLKVVLPGLRLDTQMVKIGLLPGNPHSLHVTPVDNSVTIENGNPLRFYIEVHDEAGNITTHSKMIVRCQVRELPLEAIDCSNTGTGHLVTKPVNLKNINGDQYTFKAKFDVPSQKHIAVVYKELTVVPSTRVSRIEVYRQDDDDLLLKDKDKIEWEAGDLLENLRYRLYDEGGRKVSLTPELTSKIKVNWTADVSLQDLAKGNLPDVHVPIKVQDEHFYQVSYQDQHVSVNTSFTIVPRPNEPKHLKATLSQSTVRMGEILPGKINLELMDQYGNVTKTLTSTCVDHFTVKADGLERSTLAITWEESSHSVVVTGVQFQSGTPGTREMCFTFRSFVEHALVKVTAGVPAQLRLISGPGQVLNEKGIPTPFLIQLCDEWGNPSPDQRVVVALKSSFSALKVRAAVMSQPVDAEGKTTFTVQSVSGPKGEYELHFKGSFNKKPLSAPSVKLTVIPDPNKPVSLAVDYDSTSKLPAGGIFPVFSVTVVSDEGSPIKHFNPAAASMFLWKRKASETTPPHGATQLKCSKPVENENDDCFHFRDKVIPDHAEKYTIQFSLRIDQTKLLWSQQYVMNVVANDPVKLAPDTQPPTPVVSNSDVIANRTLVEDMTLRIMDVYGNAAAQELEGKVVVSIRSCSGANSKGLPLFEGKVNTLQIKLSQGKVHIARLAIIEKSPGQDGHEYILHFKPEVPKCPTPLAAFELRFRFYNDAENQHEMSELSKKKDELSTAIGFYKEIFNGYSELLTLLTNVDKVFKETAAEAERIMNEPRRVCSIPDPFRGGQDVLGKVGHLALVEDDAAAVVLSWHIMGDMDCVITKTTAAARRIYDDTQGRQQVMPLDSVYWNPNNRSLPHIKYGRSIFQPIGNPRFARDLLIYSGDQESCNMDRNLRIYFMGGSSLGFYFMGGSSLGFYFMGGSSLGALLLERKLDLCQQWTFKMSFGVTQNKIPCPTILTRQGERISAKGKFGGTQNKAPPIERLHGQVFGAPLPQRYHTLQGQIEQLGLYRSALQKKEQAKKDRDNHILKLSAPDVVRKEEEMEEKKQQLEEIERKLVPQEAPLPRKPLGHLDRLQPQQGAQGLGLGHCIHQLLQSEFPTGRAPPIVDSCGLILIPFPHFRFLFQHHFFHITIICFNCAFSFRFVLDYVIFDSRIIFKR
ncbi:structural maintenance of chromosomes flexible hinge domain-containing protein 1-like [Diretmus argenteus]